MTTNTTEKDLVEEVEELLAKATPGPWHEWQLSPDSDPAQRLIVVAGNDADIEITSVIENEDDATLIAATPDLLRRLVDEVKRREGLIVHMHVHSGYKSNGYLQMTTEQKDLYDAIWNRSVKELDDEERGHD